MSQETAELVANHPALYRQAMKDAKAVLATSLAIHLRAAALKLIGKIDWNKLAIAVVQDCTDPFDTDDVDGTARDALAEALSDAAEHSQIVS